MSRDVQPVYLHGPARSVSPPPAFAASADASSLRLSALRLIVLGLAPFAAGSLAARSSRLERMASVVRCPLRWATGIPCPACGSTRTFVAFARLDPDWREENPMAVLYAATIVGLGGGLLMLPERQRRRLGDDAADIARRLRHRPWLSVLVVAVAAVPPWLCAIRLKPNCETGPGPLRGRQTGADSGRA